jgi:hypothetical protein
MLNQYLANTRLLLNDSNSQIYTDGELTGYINRARSYVATLGECVRDFGSATVVTNNFNLLYHAVLPSTLTGGAKLYNPRDVFSAGGTPFEIYDYAWLQHYIIPYGLTGSRKVAAFYRQGSVDSTVNDGRIILYLGPDIVLPHAIFVDGIWVPGNLIDDTTAEPIPLLWQEPVTYYAAALALMRAQRQADATEMMQRFNDLMTWAREAVTPSQTPDTSAALGGSGTKAAAGYGPLNQPQQQGNG